MQNRSTCGFGKLRRRHGIICPVSECEPQAKHELSGIDTMFLSEHERYAKWSLEICYNSKPPLARLRVCAHAPRWRIGL